MAAVATSLVVGEISDGTAVLTSEALEVFRMPLALLPQPLAVGMVVDLHAAVNPRAQAVREQSVMQIQHALCERLRLPPPAATPESLQRDLVASQHAAALQQAQSEPLTWPCTPSDQQER